MGCKKTNKQTKNVQSTVIIIIIIILFFIEKEVQEHLRKKKYPVKNKEWMVLKTWFSSVENKIQGKI